MLSSLIRALRRKPDVDDYATRLEVARQSHADGAFDDAEAEFMALAGDDPGTAEAWLHAGLCAFALGRAAPALERVRKACALQPGEHRHLFSQAGMLAAMGDVATARELVCRTLAIAPTFNPAYLLWSSLELPGEDYITLLPRLHEFLRPATYLEIGVFEGRSLQFVGPGTQAIGVDPKPVLAVPVPPTARVLATTSDDFFAQHDVRAEFGGRPVELGFIDGMHLFEYALRDFINMERVSSPAGTILVHDCYPLDRRSAERERHATFWSGDIWRLVLILKKYRPDLQVHSLALAPTGLGLIRGLDPASTVLADRYDEIVAEFMALDYGVLASDKPGLLNLFPNRWDDIAGLLRESLPGRGGPA